ncbi:hypothetical protein ACFLU6_04910 [Acidobacteriota bacterium]
MKRVFHLMVILVMGSAVVDADPRWWRHEAALTSNAYDKGWPDVALPGYMTGGLEPMAVVWEQWNDSGNRDVWLLLSLDRGCTWCAPKRWAGDPVADERRPRVELGVYDFRWLWIMVVYERDDLVYVSYDKSLDGSSMDLCTDLAAAIPTTGRLSRDNSGGEIDSRPRLVKASNMSNLLDFHAVWQRDYVAGSPTVEYSNHTLGRNDWLLPGRDLTAEIGGNGSLAAVAADNVAVATNVSAVNVYYVDPGSGNLQVSRHNQSADTAFPWIMTGVDVSTSGPPSWVMADSSGPNTMVSFAFNGVVFQDLTSSDIFFDAAFWDDPALPPSRDYNLLNDHLCSDQAEDGLEPALIIDRMEMREPIALFTFWPLSQGIPELYSRAGVLDADAATPRDLDLFPFEPLRVSPPDPVTSTVNPFAFCDWDEATGDCVLQSRPPSSVFGAREVSAADGGGMMPSVHAVVFTDDRTGEKQIYFKIADHWVWLPPIESTAAWCLDLQTPRAEVSFGLMGECPQPWEDELIERYFLYWGTSGNGGPFPDRLVYDNAGLSNPTVETFDGLTPGVTYTFVAIAEDQARNIHPPGFDPLGDTNVPNDFQTADVAMPECSPALNISACTYNGVRCKNEPWDTTGRNPYPGETVLMTITLMNDGDWAATALTGTITVANAEVTDPPGGDLSLTPIADIQPGLTADVVATFRVDRGIDCPAELNVEITGLLSNGGAVSHGVVACANPFLVVDDCTQECDPCDVGGLSSLGNSLMAVKAGAARSDITFLWQVPGSYASEYHVNWVEMKTSIPGAKRNPAGSGAETCTELHPAGGCTVAGEVASGQDLRFYEAFAACGASKGLFRITPDRPRLHSDPGQISRLF